LFVKRILIMIYISKGEIVIAPKIKSEDINGNILRSKEPRIKDYSNLNKTNLKEKIYRDVFVIKTYDEVSSKAEYLFIDKEEYFLGSVTEDEIERKSYSLACAKFIDKSPLSETQTFRFTISK